jgi:hypothetical protein
MPTDLDRTIYVVEPASRRRMSALWRLTRHAAFALCLVAAVGLVVLNVAVWRGDIVESGPVTNSTVPGGSPSLIGPVEFSAVATRGPCFVEVRVGGASGKLLYKGTLAKGRAVSFAENRLWVRVGATQNLTVRLNGQVVRGLPTPNGDAIVTSDGIRPVGTT